MSPGDVLGEPPKGPASRGPEGDLLGALMHASMLPDLKLLEQVLPIVGAYDFESQDHRAIFNAIADLYKAGKSVEPALVRDQLAAVGRLEMAGGADRLLALVEPIQNPANAVEFARTVGKLSRRRKLRDSCRRILERPDGVELNGEKEVLEVALREVTTFDSAPTEEVRPWSTLEELDKETEALANAPRIALSLPGVDEALGGGVIPGNVVIFGAFTSGGKTSNGIYQCEELSAAGHPALYITAEQNPQEISLRIRQTRPGVAFPNLGIMRPRGDIFRVLEDARIWLEEHDGSEHVPVVMFDYIQKFRAPADVTVRERQVATVAEQIGDFSRSTGALVLAAAQLNRRSKEVTPDLSHFRETGVIEQVADVAILFAKPAPGALWAKIAKNRHGKSDDEFELQADWEALKFTRATTADAQSILGAKPKAPEHLRARILKTVDQLASEKKIPTNYDTLAGLLAVTDRSLKEHVPALAAIGALRVEVGRGRGSKTLIWPAKHESVQSVQ